MIVYNYDADLEVSDTCVRSSLLSWVELSSLEVAQISLAILEFSHSSSLLRFNFTFHYSFSIFSSKLTVSVKLALKRRRTWQIFTRCHKSHHSLHMLQPCETLNVIKQLSDLTINYNVDVVQVHNYWRCGGVDNNQIMKGLLLSRSLQNKVSEYLAMLQAVFTVFLAV